jgi:hypothetical protein
MKRIIQEYSTNLNETAFESLKPLYGTKGNPPYYDPNDLHAHIWKKGKLGIEDNPKIPTYAKGKLVIKDCVYCKICHLVQDSFQSTVGQNRDIVIDIIKVSDDQQIKSNDGYKIIKPIQDICKFELYDVPEYEQKFPKKINQKLFHNQEGVFEEYVKVCNETKLNHHD